MDTTERDYIVYLAERQDERARSLFDAATHRGITETVTSVLRELAEARSRLSTSDAAGHTHDSRWLSFIHAQVAVATWRLDVVEQALKTDGAGTTLVR